MEKKAHVINNKTGYCYTCKKYENDELKDSKYTEYKSFSTTRSTPTSARKDAFTEEPLQDDIKTIKYKLYENCDCSKGALGEKFRVCRLFEAVYYVPIWSMVLLTTIFVAFTATTVTLGSVYGIALQLKSYNQDCSITSCDASKGLYCRKTNSSTLENCWCPANVFANNCDCPSSYYWDGIKCAPVHGYGQGQCSGDYSCYKGLMCDVNSGVCKCPDIKPEWDPIGKLCNYAYKGCFNDCINLTSCDYTITDIVLQVASNTWFIEIDDCLSMCLLYSYKYGIISYSPVLVNGVPQTRCACSNTYNKFATQTLDSFCNQPCSYSNPTGQNRCTKTNFMFSAFQIGA